MPFSEKCVEADRLRAYLLGNLPAATSGEVESHLEQCPTCRAEADRLDSLSDPIMLSLRQALVAARPGSPERWAGHDTLDDARFHDAAGNKVGTPRPNIAGYEVLGELGRGGMSVVYRARQLLPSRMVALKMILAGTHAAPEQRARFLVEADAIARLQHPNIVGVFEVGLAQDVPFYSMELVEGGSLAKKLAGTPQPPGQAAALLETLARAVHYAHQHGVIHRDIKPENVLLSPLDVFVPKLADFGLARLEQDHLDDGGAAQGPAQPRGQTVSGTVLGTPSYMAPEQAQGKNKEVSAAADVYSLGAVLYECLTGRPPFRAASPLDTLMQVINNEPVPPRRLNPKVPRDLETVVLKCLAKYPAERYATAEALAEDLRRFVADQPIKARRTPWHERSWRWYRRNPAVATLLAAVALLLVLLTGGTLVKNAELRGALKQSDAARRETADALWVSFHDQARAVRFSGRQGQRFEGLRAIRNALQRPVPEGHSLDELRTEAIACLSLPDVEVLREWEDLPGGIHTVASDGRMETYVAVDASGQVGVRRVVNDAPIASVTTSIKNVAVFLSPDGHFLLLRGGTLGNPVQPMEVWSLAGGRPERCLSEPAVVTHCEAFSADSRRLAYQRADGMMVVQDLTTGRPVGQWRLPGPRMNWALAFHPEGKQMAVGVIEGAQPVILVCDVTTGAVTARLPHPKWCHGVAWHPDGRRLAVGCDDYRIHLWDVLAQKELATWEGHKIGGVSLRGFKRSGSQLLSIDWSHVLRVWDTESGQQVFSAPLRSDHLAAAPDGEDGMQILSPDVGARMRLLRLARGQEHRRLVPRTSRGSGQYNSYALLSRDDRLLAAPSRSPTGEWELALVDPGSGQRLAAIPAAERGGDLRPLGYEPSGALITYFGGYGLLRWPVRREPASIRRVGPPKRLLSLNVYDRWGCSADAQVVAIPQYNNGAWVGRPEVPESWHVLRHQADVRGCSVSPDGRLVATYSHACPPGEYGCKVWNVADRTIVKEFSPGTEVTARFSPDGRWLAVADNSGVRLWQVDGWKEGSLLANRWVGFAFGPDSLIALGGDSGEVRLCVTETGRELARLQVPDATRFSPLFFSHDGSQFFAFGEEDRAIHVWDLRRIRRQLAELGLDWVAPPIAEPLPEADRPPLRVEVDPGDLAKFGAEATKTQAQQQIERLTRAIAANPNDAKLYRQRGLAYQSLGQYEKAVADLEKSLQHKPDQADLCNDLAWLYATGPTKLRDPGNAVSLAQRAVKLDPKAQAYHNTLGVALYRAGRHREAIASFQKSLAASVGDFDGYDLYFLAMCHAQLGETAKAKDCFAGAEKWRQARKGLSRAHEAELKTFRGEAAGVLGLK